MLKRVEADYGWPQDIEWGWKDGQLYLLQSRAVTTLQPRYTRDESAERFPNPMTPLTWDFLGAVFRRSLAHSLNLMGYSASGLVTESGGPLSHGAVTAREMRLPAVMSVRGIMTLVQNGQELTVDGTQGLVLIMNDPD